MKNYELLYLVSGQYTDAEAETIKGKVDELLKKYGAILGYQENMGKRRLAYPIQKTLHAYYLVTEFELEDGPALKSFTNDLNLDKEILRAQIIIRPKAIREKLAKARKERTHLPVGDKKEAAKEKPADRTDKKDDAKSKKISIDNLDEKLDEMLSDDNIL